MGIGALRRHYAARKAAREGIAAPEPAKAVAPPPTPAPAEPEPVAEVVPEQSEPTKAAEPQPAAPQWQHKKRR